MYGEYGKRYSPPAAAPEYVLSYCLVNPVSVLSAMCEKQVKSMLKKSAECGHIRSFCMIFSLEIDEAWAYNVSCPYTYPEVSVRIRREVTLIGGGI